MSPGDGNCHVGNTARLITWASCINILWTVPVILEDLSEFSKTLHDVSPSLIFPNPASGTSTKFYLNFFYFFRKRNRHIENRQAKLQCFWIKVYIPFIQLIGIKEVWNLLTSLSVMFLNFYLYCDCWNPLHLKLKINSKLSRTSINAILYGRTIPSAGPPYMLQ